MPLKTALRNTFFLPKASSRPCGQVAKINHSAAATTIRMMNAHNGWRSMNFVMGATCAATVPEWGQAAGLPQAALRTLPHSYRSERPGLDRQYPSARRLAGSGPEDLGGASIVRRRHADIACEEVRKRTLRRKAEIEADVGDRRFGGHQRIQRSFHQERVDVEVWRDAGLRAEKFVEMWTRKPGLAR